MGERRKKHILVDDLWWRKEDIFLPASWLDKHVPLCTIYFSEWLLTHNYGLQFINLTSNLLFFFNGVCTTLVFNCLFIKIWTAKSDILENFTTDVYEPRMVTGSINVLFSGLFLFLSKHWKTFVFVSSGLSLQRLWHQNALKGKHCSTSSCHPWAYWTYVV